MERHESFGAWMQDRRLRLRLTQKELGEMAHCATDTIRAYESDRRRPPVDVVRAIARALQMPPESYAELETWARTGTAPRDMSRIAGTVPAATVPQEQPTATSQPTRDVMPDVLADSDLHAEPPATPPRTSGWHRVASSATRWPIMFVGLMVLLFAAALVLTQSDSPGDTPPANPSATSAPAVGAVETLPPVVTVMVTPTITLVPPKQRLGGLWVSPTNGTEIDISRGPIRLVARAYTATPTDPPISRVEFTITFPPSEWQLACAAPTPVSEVSFPRANGVQIASTDDPRMSLVENGEMYELSVAKGDIYTCLWDVSRIIVPSRLRPGFQAEAVITFNVFDPYGGRHDAPHGERRIRLTYRGN